MRKCQPYATTTRPHCRSGCARDIGVRHGARLQFRAVRTPSTPVIYRPQGPGPFPAVVALHGCDGVVAGSGKVGANYADWGGRLADAGFVVLFPDSFGVGSGRSAARATARCARSSSASTTRPSPGAGCSVSPTSSKTGFRCSAGRTAQSALWAVRPRAMPHDNLPDFRSAVAFYPGCGTLDTAEWSARPDAHS